MFVVKRCGKKENVDFVKIERCAIWAAKDLSIDYTEVVNEERLKDIIYDGIPTHLIQDVIANQAVTKITENWDWTYFASRFLLQKIRKQANNGSIVYPSLIDYIKRIKTECNRKVDDFLSHYNYDFDELQRALNTDLDFDFSYLALSSLYDRYLLRNKEGQVIELPQHFFMRVAMGLAKAEPKGKRTEYTKNFYEVLSQKTFMSSTPTLFNSGMKYNQLSSCFGAEMHDSFEDIHRAISELNENSKFAGGNSLSMSRIRANGSYISSTGGQSSGVIPFAKLVEQGMRCFDQGGKRPGVCAVYLETWHKDILSFLEMPKAARDDRLSTKDLFIATWNTDEFMRRVYNDEMWSLFCPNDVPDLPDAWGEDFEYKYKKYEKDSTIPRVTVRAQEVWNKILELLFNQKGLGWPCFKDTANKRSMTRGYGVVHNSNLCVAPETKILTNKGYFEIHELENENVTVWNGFEWSETVVRKTGINKELLRVTLDNGVTIDCTPEHKFYLNNDVNNAVQARYLKTNDALLKHNVPVIIMENAPDFPSAYTHGFFCGDGTYTPDLKKKVYLYDEKKKIEPYLDIVSGSGVPDASGRLSFFLDPDLAEKYEVPSYHSLRSRLEWLAGWLDADGCIARNGDNVSLQAASTSLAFLKEVQLMLQTLGVQAKIKTFRAAGKFDLPDGKGGYAQYECKMIYRLLINSGDTQKLLSLGMETHRLEITKHEPNRCASRFVRVVSVENLGRVDDTYCFTEEKRHLGMFNGICTGQCTEILLRNSESESFVCNLGSINLANIDTNNLEPYKNCSCKLEYVIATAVRMIDNAVTVGYLPSENNRKFNQADRPLGLGVMGYAQWLVQNKIDYESQEHLDAADEIYEKISFYAINASADLAQEKGSFPNFNKSQWAQGELPIDTAFANVYDDLISEKRKSVHTFDWDSLREKTKIGMRNSNLLATAPTATISNICDSTACTELPYDNTYERANASGTYIMISHTLRIAQKLGVEHLAKTSKQVDQLWNIKAACVRQQWIDQAQSTNIFVKDTNSGDYLTQLYMTGWYYGLPTFYYLHSESAKEKIIKVETPDNTIAESEDAEAEVCMLGEACTSCQ